MGKPVVVENGIQDASTDAKREANVFCRFRSVDATGRCGVVRGDKW